MANLEFKNEADFLANTHETKKKMFNDMCNSILRNYNKITGGNYKYPDTTKTQTSLFRLFDKLEHIAFYLYSPQSIPKFLNRIATKPAKVISKPGYYYKGSYDQEEVYGLGHFRWDFKAYTLDENELQAIRIYLGLHTTNVVKATKKVFNSNAPKPNFNLITGYNEQAEAFLNWTGTIFTAEFKEHAIYFDGDKDSRDIYTCVLKNSRNRYRFTFGQSISNMGTAPTAYDILASIQKYDIYDFNDFCGELGYDVDSRTAYKTYKAVKKEWKNVNKLFTSEELELLQEIN